MNPILSLDIGTRWGASALQIATGSEAAPDPKGRTISIDKYKLIAGTKHKTGKFIPITVPVELVYQDAVSYMKKADVFYELIYEDGAHTESFTKAIYEQAIERLVAGGIIMSHDVCIPRWANSIVAGIRSVGIEPELYLVDGDGCGLSIWQKPIQNIQEVMSEESKVAEPLHLTFDLSEGAFVDEPEIEYPEILEELTSEPEPEIEIPEELVPEPEKPKKKRRTKNKKSIEDV